MVYTLELNKSSISTIFFSGFPCLPRYRHFDKKRLECITKMEQEARERIEEFQNSPICTAAGFHQHLGGLHRTRLQPIETDSERIIGDRSKW